MSRRGLAFVAFSVGALLGQLVPDVALHMLVHRRSVFG
jgi:hypothetical protein